MNREEQIKAENAKRIKILALEMKDREFLEIEQFVKTLQEKEDELALMKENALQMIANYKQTRGFFIPIAFAYNSGYEKIDLKSAADLCIEHNLQMPLVEIVQKKADEKALIELFEGRGIPVPYMHTKESIGKPRKTQKEGD